MASLYVEAPHIELSELDRWTIGAVIALESSLFPFKLLLRLFSRRVNRLEAKVKSLSNHELHAELRKVSNRADQEALAFALVREGGRRTLGLFAHDVQIMAMRALKQGRLAEMQTGEGKSLTAALTACIVASTGIPVHVITVNDYLAQRDAEKMAPLFALFGLSVAAVTSKVAVARRALAYQADVTYCTNKDVAFDYLRDGVAAAGAESAAQRAVQSLYLAGALAPPKLTLRGLHFAIVDEADSVLIDEARTPLILSSQKAEASGQDLYSLALEIARALLPNIHFVSDALQRHFSLLDAGKRLLEQVALGETWRQPVVNQTQPPPSKTFSPKPPQTVWRSAAGREFLLEQALKALHGLKLDRDYIIQEGKVAIVDESTGRVLADRNWERGLHQLVESKEGLELSGESHTIARITFQRFFSRYCMLSGMTGTVSEARHEMAKVYGLKLVKIATNKPSRRVVEPACFALSQEAKWMAVIAHVQAKVALRRPVLIGTQTVQDSQLLSDALARLSIEHSVLNASQDAEEAEIISAAGRAATVTVATNMAGRGTDILLDAVAAKVGGLHVILTNFHESARVDRQLFGRAARQGDAGSACAVVSLDDALFRQYAPRLASGLARWVAGSSTGRVAHGMPRLGFNGGWRLRFLRAITQYRAERYNRAIRDQTRKSDTQLRQNLGFAGASE
jgi:preprotein translocase subunit SecA